MVQEPVKIGATLDSISTRKDKSLKIIFESQEIGAEQAANLFNLRDQFGWVIFAPSGLQEIEIPNEPPPEFANQKSYSQRVRGALYRLWEQKGKHGDSESFYREHMEKILNWIKDRLEPEA